MEATPVLSAPRPIAPFHYTTPDGYQTLNGELRAASAAGESVKRYERILPR